MVWKNVAKLPVTRYRILETERETAMPPQPYKARFEDRSMLNDSFMTVSFELVEPTALPFLAGQYVSIQVAPDGNRRSYSIASRPDTQSGFELLIDVSPGGLGSQFLQNTPLGTEVSLLGPLGGFIIQEQPAEEAIVLVGTGSGIAPLRSMILDQLQVKQDKRPITLYWGLRYAESLFWENDFQDLVEAFPNFSFNPVLSRPGEGWTLSRGRVTDLLAVHTLPANAGYYLCGGKPMIESVVALHTGRGVGAEYIHHENFF